MSPYSWSPKFHPQIEKDRVPACVKSRSETSSMIGPPRYTGTAAAPNRAPEASEHGGTSRFASSLIGEREVVRAEHSRGSSRGGFFSTHGYDSVSEHTSYRDVTESAVMASQIEQLPDLHGYLKLASSRTWRRVALRPDS